MQKESVLGLGFVCLFAALGAGCGMEDEENIGFVQQADYAASASPPVQVSPTTTAHPPASAPTMAWIKSKETSLGSMLIGYTDFQEGVGEITAWASSETWWYTSSPDWSIGGNAYDDGWSAPINALDVYFPGAVFDGYRGMAQVVWSGLDDVAVAIDYSRIIGGMNVYTDVVVRASTTRGETWDGDPLILSIDTLSGISGGEITPGSVYASLMYTPERISSDAGDQAIPIVVIWENEDLTERKWWLTTIVAGIDGTVVQTMIPREIRVLPPGANATILAYKSDQGSDTLELAWAEREDALSPTACPTVNTINVSWRTSFSPDLGETWSCLPGSGTCLDDEIAEITEDETWRPCVGASFTTEMNAPNVANNARPELVMSRGDNYRLLAINRYNDVSQAMRVEVWYDADSAAQDWDVVYTSPDEDECGRKLGDTVGQALAMTEGHDTVGWSVPVVTYRAALPQYGNDVTMRYAFSYGDGETTWGDGALTDGAGDSWAVTQPWGPGPTNAVAASQTCLFGECSSEEPGHTLDLPFGAAWTDEHQGNNSEIWTRRFPFSATTCGQ